MARPTLSVLMPNYNHARFLPQALRALLTQSRRPDEIVVIDDASTDYSVEILNGFAHESPLVRLELNERNQGVVPSMNKLLDLAMGEYVYFAAADDMVLDGFFAKSMSMLAEYPRAGLWSCLSRSIDEYGRDTGLCRTPVVSMLPCFLEPRRALEALRIYGSWIQGDTVVWRRDVLLELGGFRPELGPFCDGFLHSVFALQYGALFTPEPLASWRRMMGGYSGTTSAAFEKSLEIRRLAGSLMRTTYRELFPEAYVAAWEKTWLRTVADTISDRLYRDQQSLLSRLSDPSQGSKPLGRSLTWGLRLLARFQHLAMQAIHLILWGDPVRWSRHQLKSWWARKKLGLAMGPDRRFSIPRGESTREPGNRSAY